MAIIPLRQTITVTKAGESDGWGGVNGDADFTLPARVSEEMNTVTNQVGEEAVTTLRIYLDRLPDITYDDVITYTNELDVTVARKPVKIEVKRSIGGKALLTEVYV